MRAVLPPEDELHPLVVEILRRKTPAQKLAMVDSMQRDMGVMLRNIIRSQNPAWSESDVQREFARRMSSGND